MLVINGSGGLYIEFVLPHMGHIPFNMNFEVTVFHSPIVIDRYTLEKIINVSIKNYSFHIHALPTSNFLRFFLQYSVGFKHLFAQ